MLVPFTSDKVNWALLWLFLYIFHKKANLFVDFKVWQNQNVNKPTYWSNENYPTMCFVTSRLRRHAKIVMSTLNADIKLTQLFSFEKIINGKWEEIISHPQCFGYIFGYIVQDCSNSSALAKEFLQFVPSCVILLSSLNSFWPGDDMATLNWANIGSGNGLLLDGTKPIPEPMHTYH